MLEHITRSQRHNWTKREGESKKKKNFSVSSFPSRSFLPLPSGRTSVCVSSASFEIERSACNIKVGVRKRKSGIATMLAQARRDLQRRKAEEVRKKAFSVKVIFLVTCKNAAGNWCPRAELTDGSEGHWYTSHEAFWWKEYEKNE